MWAIASYTPLQNDPAHAQSKSNFHDMSASADFPFIRCGRKKRTDALQCYNQKDTSCIIRTNVNADTKYLAFKKRLCNLALKDSAPSRYRVEARGQGKVLTRQHLKVQENRIGGSNVSSPHVSSFHGATFPSPRIALNNVDLSAPPQQPPLSERHQGEISRDSYIAAASKCLKTVAVLPKL